MSNVTILADELRQQRVWKICNGQGGAEEGRVRDIFGKMEADFCYLQGL